MSVVSLGSNLSSIKAQRQLNGVSREVTTIYERLSSGQRINKASDDAAGLAVVMSLDANRRVYTQGVRNLNDGVSLLNIADGAIEQLSSIVIRLKELAEQSANGTYGAKQREAIDGEAQALSKEFSRITRSTTFNGRGLFHSEFGDLRLQGGYGLDGGIQSSLGGAIGKGTFGEQTTYGDAGFISKLADLNSDGIIDAVTSGLTTTDVRLGKGDGTFGDAVSYTPYGLVIDLGDVNGDGIIDLVSSGIGISVQLGKGDGTFGPNKTFDNSGQILSRLSLADINGDGNLDVAGLAGSQYLILTGTGNGTFAKPITFATTAISADATGLEIADINNDGKLDIIGSSYDTSGEIVYVEAFLGNGNGTMSNAFSMAIASNAITSITSGDFNGDGKVDFALGVNSDSINTYLGTGNGSFNFTYSIAVSEASVGMATGDINGDGLTDILTGGYQTSTSSVLLGSGNGSFTQTHSFVNDHGSISVHLKDLNRDGVLDAITTGFGGSSGLSVRLAETTAGISPLNSFSLKSRSDALQAFSEFNYALNRLSGQRGKIGAFQSRLTVATNVLQTSSENFAAASSRIKDADISEESAKLVRTQILQKAGAAVLGQANLQPSLALTLLKN